MTSPIHPTQPPTRDPESLADMLRALLLEARDYARDLGRMFAAELSEKSRSLRTLAAMATGAALLLFVGFVLLSLALVGAIAYGLGSWPWALLIVGVAYCIIGLITLIPVTRGLSSGLLRFEHTRNRIKNDAEFAKRKLAA